MAESQGQIPFVEYDDDGRIDQDLPCLKCGYNLRSLLDDGQCPECGHSVYESARLAWLCQHDSVWLHKLVVATIWIEFALVCFGSLPAILLWGMFVRRASVDAILTCVAMLVAGAIAGLMGFWPGTSPCPDSRVRHLRVRRVARFAMMAGLASFLLFASSRSSFRLLGIPRWIIRPLLMPLLLCLGAGAWATLTYASALAGHVPKARLVRRQARIVAWGFAICFLVAAVVVVTQLMFTVSLVPWRPLLTFSSAGFLILTVWTIPLLHWYRRRFQEAVRIRQR